MRFPLIISFQKTKSVFLLSIITYRLPKDIWSQQWVLRRSWILSSIVRQLNLSLRLRQSKIFSWFESQFRLAKVWFPNGYFRLYPWIGYRWCWPDRYLACLTSIKVSISCDFWRAICRLICPFLNSRNITCRCRLILKFICKFTQEWLLFWFFLVFSLTRSWRSLMNILNLNVIKDLPKRIVDIVPEFIDDRSGCAIYQRKQWCLTFINNVLSLYLKVKV